MPHLKRHGGGWAGSNAFRLMPGDAPQDAPMQATVAHAAGDHLVQIAYAWHHPRDGEQHGLLVLGPGPEAGAVIALWGDSWHQSPEARALVGTADGDIARVGYTYSGDWRWEIEVDASSPDTLIVTMDNIIPSSAATDEMPAGPYVAMRAVLRPAA